MKIIEIMKVKEYKKIEIKNKNVYVSYDEDDKQVFIKTDYASQVYDVEFLDEIIKALTSLKELI